MEIREQLRTGLLKTLKSQLLQLKEEGVLKKVSIAEETDKFDISICMDPSSALQFNHILMCYHESVALYSAMVMHSTKELKTEIGEELVTTLLTNKAAQAWTLAIENYRVTKQIRELFKGIDTCVEVEKHHGATVNIRMSEWINTTTNWCNVNRKIFIRMSQYVFEYQDKFEAKADRLIITLSENIVQFLLKASE